MYRHTPPAAIKCPRCKKLMPPTDPASCACGTWLSAFAASVLLTDKERWQNHATRWWRVREPCPHCGDKMTLCNNEPGLLQGCEIHGYFIDADTVEHTSLAKGIDHVALARAREDEARVEAHREQQLREEQERDHEKREKAEAERRLRSELSLDLSAQQRRARARAWLEQESERERRDRERASVERAALRTVQLELDSAVGEEVAAVIRQLAERVSRLEDDKAELEEAVRVLADRVRALGARTVP